MITVESIQSDCPRCGASFEQAADPGRRRVFCSNRCRQADYRTRSGRTGHEAEQERRRKEQERKDEQARKARERRRQEAREQAHRAGADWASPCHGGEYFCRNHFHAHSTPDTTAEARARGKARKLMDRANHARTNEHEADACRQTADRIKSKYGF